MDTEPNSVNLVRNRCPQRVDTEPRVHVFFGHGRNSPGSALAVANHAVFLDIVAARTFGTDNVGSLTADRPPCPPVSKQRMSFTMYEPIRSVHSERRASAVRAPRAAFARASRSNRSPQRKESPVRAGPGLSGKDDACWARRTQCIPPLVVQTQGGSA